MRMAAAPPSLSDQADALVDAGRIGEAYRLLTSPPAATDPEALIRLAEWRLGGQFIRRDLAASRDLFRRAAEAGQSEAARVHAAFVANGTGGAADWPAAVRLLQEQAARDPDAAAQLALIGAMRLSPSGDPLELPPEETLGERPHVSSFRGLLSGGECDFLVAAARPWLEPSLVVDPASGRLVQNPVRTSDAMAFPFVQESPAIHALNRRMAAASGTAPAQGEPLQVLRYRGGQEYKPHLDAVTGDPNQRILTMLVYLNEDYEGGETLFVRTGLRFRGRKGDALLFRNALPDGRGDAQALHAGLPVPSGEKLIASRWIRARPFLLPAPRPLLPY
jgi:prolyl 4-hydroxylase